MVSKLGSYTTLTPYDFMAIRYGISSLVALPFLLYLQPWKDMPIRRIIILTFLLGPFYTFCVFNAFNYAPAAHGGIFMNGAFPVLTILLGAFFFKELPVGLQVFGLAPRHQLGARRERRALPPVDRRLEVGRARRRVARQDDVLPRRRGAEGREGDARPRVRP